MTLCLPPSVLRTSPPQGGRVFAGEISIRISEQKDVRLVRHVGNCSLHSPPLWGRCHEVTEGGTLQNKEPNYLA